jgi:hypothetical protein
MRYFIYFVEASLVGVYAFFKLAGLLLKLAWLVVLLGVSLVKLMPVAVERAQWAWKTTMSPR